MSPEDKRELALRECCLREGYSPAIVSLSLQHLRNPPGGKMMDMIMPNGNTLAECTGEDLQRFGDFFTNKLAPLMDGGKVVTA